MKSLTLAICFSLSSLVISLAKAEPYDYPLTSPFAATVVGTHNSYKADLPEDIPVEDLEVTVFRDRELPEVLWYSDSLRYSLVAQDQAAPLIFVIAGTGAGYHSAKMQVLQRVFYQAGFHVVSLSSPTHPNFIVSASTTGVPGYLLEDAQDLYRVMVLTWLQIKQDIEVTEFYLTGYSLGAAQAAFLARLDEQREMFQFQKILLINTPVSLYTSALILDDMLEKNIPGGLDNIQSYIDQVFHAFSEVYRRGAFVNFTGDFLYTAYETRKPPDSKLAALIGISFRLSSANMVFTSDVFTNSGFIKPMNLTLSTTDSVTDYFKVSARVSFQDYFKEVFAPYFQSGYPGLTKSGLIQSLGLKDLEEYLRQTTKIGLVHNADDVILGPGELDYLREVFGARAEIYPRGGHCGNLAHRDDVADMVRFFRDGVATFSADLEPIQRSFQPLGQNPSENPVKTLVVSTSAVTPPTPGRLTWNNTGSADSVEYSKRQNQLGGQGSPIKDGQVGMETQPPMPGFSNTDLLVKDIQKPRTKGEPNLQAKRQVSQVVKSDVQYPVDVYDPLQRWNRTFYKFNAKFDEYVFLPVVHGYKAVLPDYVEDRVSNFFSNISDIRNLLNAVFQLKLEVSRNTLVRFMINATLGIAGFWDHATTWGFPQQTEDFGQTLGHYGVGAGAYMVLPILGPSSLRDGTGLIVDYTARYFYLFVPIGADDSFAAASAFTLINGIDTRHQISFRYFQTGSPFEYDLVRFLYSKKRKLEIEK